MKIQAVLIDGYKNLSNVRITFDKITALVSLNNFGKSNVLSGIDFGLTFMKASIEDKALMMTNTYLIPLNQSMLYKNFRFEIEGLIEEKGQEFRVQYGYEFSWHYDEGKEPKIVKEYLRVKLNEKGQKYTQLIDRVDDRALYKSCETGRCSLNISIDSLELVVNKLRAFDDLYYINIIKKINSMKMYMENNMDVKSFYQSSQIIRKGWENELINADSLPWVVYNIKNKYPDKFELLRDVFLQLFDNIEDIIVKKFNVNGIEDEITNEDMPYVITNSIYVLFVKDKNLLNPVNFSMMSDGSKRVFMILTKLVVSSISNVSLIAIEEPENSVHPGLFQSYVQIISQLLDDCKIIITSHSSYIISYLNPSWIQVGVNRVPGVAEFFTFKKTGQRQLENDAQALNMTAGDYLFSMLADRESNIGDYLGI